jgi:hypothetical protein
VYWLNLKISARIAVAEGFVRLPLKRLSGKTPKIDEPSDEPLFSEPKTLLRVSC